MGFVGMLRRLRRRREAGDRGAAMVEFVLIAPVFALLVAGVLEFGLAFRDSMTVSNAIRAGARVGSNAGRERSADYTILKAIEAAMAEVPSSHILRVIVYKADTANSNVPNACLNVSGSGGIPGTGGVSCNVYQASDLSRPLSDFTGTTSCGSGAPDRYWCPTTRQATQALGADYLGVYMEVRYTYVTKIFPGSGVTIHDRAVMRLEPRLT
jgi:Flp pilus assembly protein TadG